MKLRNKLIPIATVAATAPCVTPMVLTSCASYNINLKDWKYDETITKKTSSDEYSDTTAPEAYYTDAIKDDYKILRNDIINNFNEGILNSFCVESTEPTIDYNEMYINNLKYEKVGSNYLLTFNAGLRTKAHGEIEAGKETTATLSGTASVKGVPYKMRWDVDQWEFAIDLDAIKTLESDWSIKIEGSENAPGLVEEKIYTFADKKHPEALEEVEIVDEFDTEYFKEAKHLETQHI